MSSQFEHEVRSLGRGASSILAGLGIALLLGFAVRVAILRYLSRAEFGALAMTLVIVSIVATVAGLGLQVGIPRSVGFYRGRNDWGRVRGIVQAGFQFTIPMSLVLASTVFFLAHPIGRLLHFPEHSWILRMFALAIPFAVHLDVCTEVLRGFEVAWARAWFQDAVPHSLKLLLLPAAMIFGLSFVAIAAIYCFSIIGAFLLLLVPFSRRLWRSLADTETVAMGRELLFFSLPLLGTGLLHLVMSWTDTLALGVLSTADEVGLYNGALTLGRYQLFLFNAVVYLYMPVASKMFAQGRRDELQAFFTMTTQWIFTLALPLVLLLLLLPGEILVFLFGEKYLPAKAALIALTLGYFLCIIIGPTGAMLTAMGRTKALLALTVIASLCNLILNPVLIPVYGILGAALSSAATYVLFHLLCAIFVQRLEGYHPFRHSYRRALALFFILSAGLFSLRWAIIVPIPTVVWIILLLVGYPLLLYWTNNLPYLPFGRRNHASSPPAEAESLAGSIVYNRNAKKG